eukprot:1157560-Pelagomonas_calceolata.AAC.1
MQNHLLNKHENAILLSQHHVQSSACYRAFLPTQALRDIKNDIRKALSTLSTVHFGHSARKALHPSQPTSASASFSLTKMPGRAIHLVRRCAACFKGPCIEPVGPLKMPRQSEQESIIRDEGCVTHKNAESGLASAIITGMLYSLITRWLTFAPSIAIILWLLCCAKLDSLLAAVPWHTKHLPAC